MGAELGSRASQDEACGRPGVVDLTWLTNIVTPYRVPVWRALSQQVDLRVLTLAQTERQRGWDSSELVKGLDHQDLRACSVQVPGVSTPLYLTGPSIARAIRRAGAPVVVLDGWESPAFLHAMVSSQRDGRAVVASYRSTLQTHRYRRGPVAQMRRWFFNRVDAVLTAGPASTEAVLALGVPAERIVTSFNSVDVGAFATGAQRVRQQEIAPRPGHRFLYVGQLIGRKNVAAAMTAFNRVRSHDDELLIVGTGPESVSLQHLARELDLAQQVHFLGHRAGDALVQAYGSCDTLVLPSSEEVWGLVVNEALASGLHVVVSAVAGIVPSVQDMQGVYIAPPTVEGLAGAMATSREDWAGAVPEPEVLQYTPAAAADAVLQAVAVARRVNNARRP